MARAKTERRGTGKQNRRATDLARQSAGDENVRLAHELDTHRVELEIQNEELRGARGELEASLARYTELYQLAPVGYAIVDRDGRIVSLNRSAARLLGVTTEGIANRSLVPYVESSRRGEFRDFLARVALSGGEVTGETVFALPSGTLHVQITGVLRSSDEHRLLLAITDVTERERAEQELIEADRRKDEFLAMLAHELRNPLMPIRMSVSLARRSPEHVEKALAVMDRQVSHLARIVDDLLDVARIKRGKMTLQCRPIDLVEVTQRTLEDHRAALDEAGVALGEAIGSEPVWIDADATRMAQVIGNVLGNAAKFTPRGGRVDIALHATDDWAELSVSDNGSGMTEQTLKHAFEPFEQAPQSEDRPRGGLGLGLAMVKGLVELHAGWVDLASAGPGRGTTITVKLPRCDAPPQRSSSAAPASVKHHRVLVIEDNRDAAETLKKALELSGQTAWVARDGLSGIALAREYLPEIIFCDIGLPGMSGYEVAQSLRAEDSLKKARLVALSGYAQPLDVERARKAGFDRHVAKPISVEQLQELLSSPPGGG